MHHFMDIIHLTGLVFATGMCYDLGIALFEALLVAQVLRREAAQLANTDDGRSRALLKLVTLSSWFCGQIRSAQSPEHLFLSVLLQFTTLL